jgi:hypothetical protein
MFGFYIISILPLLAYELYYDRTFLSCIIGLMVHFLFVYLRYLLLGMRSDEEMRHENKSI